MEMEAVFGGLTQHIFILWACVLLFVVFYAVVVHIVIIDGPEI
jgi:hypothetical protein